MIDPITSVSALQIVYEIGKVWLPIGGFFLFCYQGWQYIKDSFTTIITKVQENTTATNELRNDFRQVYIPLLTARPARAKTTIKKK